jgi:hypothetical protein
MFPRSFSSVLMVVGAIWTVQGLGIIPTGSFMDKQPLWAVIGSILFLVGLFAFLRSRRQKADKH